MQFRGGPVTLEASRLYTSGAVAYAAVDATGGRELIFRGNDFSGSIDRVIAMHGSHERATHQIANNYIHDITTTWPALIDNYYGANNVRIERNVIVSPPGGQIVRVQRVGLGYVANNIFKNAGTVFNNTDAGGHYTVRNNLFLNVGTVYDVMQSAPPAVKCQEYKADGDPSVGSWDIDYNSYFDVGSIVDADVQNCITRGQSECSGGPTCNPFLDSDGDGIFNETDDFRPTVASVSLIDKGDRSTPIPVGGGASVDIGRFEFGASSIAPTSEYDYQPVKTTPSVTPRISWTFRDVDNVRSGATISTQGAYRVLVDRLPTFNSRPPGLPLIDSGLVFSSAQSYDVPAGFLEVGTTYYVCVCTADSVENAECGTMSDPRWSMQISEGGPGGLPAPENLRRTDER